MDGLLDFIKTPEGQGLLAAGFGGLANARRGAPLNTLGGAGLAGLQGYAGAQDRQLKMAEEAQMKQLREQQIQQAKYANEQASADRDLSNLAAKFYQPAQSAMPAQQQTSVDDVGQIVGGEVTPAREASAGGFDQIGFLNAAKAINPIKAAALAKSLQGETNWVAAKQFDKDNNIIHGFVNTKAANPATTFTPLGGETEKQKLEMLNRGGVITPTNAYTAAPAGADISTIVKPDTTADIQSREKIAGMVDSRSRDANRIANEGKVSTTSTVLRKEFDDLPEVKNYKQAVPAYRAVEDAATRNTTASDINLVYGIAKLYDPNSVVREGEYATIAKSPNIPEKVKGYAQYLTNGGRLTDAVKQDILTEARGRMGSFEQSYEGARKGYESIASRSGAEPTLLFPSAYQSVVQSPKKPMPPSPQNPKPNQKTILRTGTSNGRKVIQYTDGSIENAN